ncbi:MAG: lamin tail domain-containing protein, partial [Candidatus Neomarinimicrobiota bacterium]
MYKVLSVCLTLGFLFGEITTIKTTNKEVLSVNESELKKPKSNDEIEKLGSHSRSSLKVNDSHQVQKRTKKYKKNKPGYKDAEQLSAQKRQAENLESNIVSKEEKILLLPKDERSQEEINLREKLNAYDKEQNSLKPLNYIQGPKSTRIKAQNIFISREHEDLFFSEYAEGSSNNKYLEIYNPSDTTVDLTGYAYPNVSNAPDVAGTHDWWNTFDTSASVDPGDVYVICHGSADSTAIQTQCDETHNYLSNGDDGYALIRGTEESFEVLDVIGQNIYDLLYERPSGGWDVAGVTNGTQDHTLVRKSNVHAGTTDWTASAGTSSDSSEWIVLDQDVWDNLGSHELEVEEEDGVYFSEGFEGDFPPANWSTSGDSVSTFYFTGEAVWQQGPETGIYGSPSFAYSGSYFAYFYDYGFSGGTVADLITSDIDLTDAVSPILYFKYYDSGGSDYVDVQVSNTDGSFSSVYLTPTATAGWEDLQVDVSSYVGQTVSIR